MSQTGNVVGSKIRTDLYGSSGSFSLNSTEARDAVMKSSGNVAYSDFRNWCWSQGRDTQQQQSGGTVLPYSLDTRADGSSFSGGFKWRTGLSGGLPYWECEAKPNNPSSSGSLTAQSYFVADRTSTHTLTFTGYGIRDSNRAFLEQECYVIQFSAGYLSGNRTNLTGATVIDAPTGGTTKNYSVTFNPSTGHYVTPVFSLRWPAWGDLLERVTLRISNARITI